MGVFRSPGFLLFGLASAVRDLSGNQLLEQQLLSPQVVGQTVYQQPPHQAPYGQTVYQQPPPQAPYYNGMPLAAAPDVLQREPPGMSPPSLPEVGVFGGVQRSQPDLAALTQFSQNSIGPMAGTASVPVQDFFQMAESLKSLQAASTGLEQQLLQTQDVVNRAQQEAAAARGRSAAAEANAKALGERSRDIAHMAESSVDEAKNTMEKERQMVQKMQAQLKETESAKAGVESQLLEAQEQLRLWKQKAFSIQKSEDEMLRNLEAQAANQLQDKRARLAELGPELPMEKPRRDETTDVGQGLSSDSIEYEQPLQNHLHNARRQSQPQDDSFLAQQAYN